VCCALSLRERGYEVTLVERDAAGGAGCSFGNAGMIVLAISRHSQRRAPSDSACAGCWIPAALST
jgi:glycine/D-amino acid oxidase-like deaminating enzyme